MAICRCRNKIDFDAEEKREKSPIGLLRRRRGGWEKGEGSVLL